MKKMISALMAAAISLSSAAFPTVSAEDAASKDIVIFGDSIAAGYGLDPEKEHNYGEICADYLGCSVNNYAVSGDTTSDMLEVIAGLSDEEKQTVADAGYIIISIGGNDLIHYASKQILNFAATKKLLKEGYTAADIPEDPDITDLMLMVSLTGEGSLGEYAQSGIKAALELNRELSRLSANLRISSGDYEGIIPNKVIPNIQTAVSQLHAINPDARIIIQTIYQPIQIEQSYVNENYGEGSNYATVLTAIREKFEDILSVYSDGISGIEWAEVADVKYQFTSLPEGVTQNDANPGHAAYFTDILAPDDEKDFHPNQRGHVAIAATILQQIGDLHDDTGMLTDTFKNLGDTISYPGIALDTYKTVAGNFILGDVTFDGAVDGRDATRVLMDYADVSSGKGPSLSTLQQKAANINLDEFSDGRDATLILRYYAYASSGGTISPDEFLGNYMEYSDL